ncbi:hypothetical protein TanjilG_32893 [Lupinus angustifolius]|uniref:Clavata3/ESR (CLE) gene family member n=1 Tax=Lupinus angustifolius TaxID=3871 RepID=A0A4P1RPG1_LUPAN|nr:hypothetical protein TanjilG_32893 [Lupinus angustifolius]
MGFLFISLFLIMLLLLSTTTSSTTAEKARRFDRFKGGSSSSELKSSEFHVGVQGNKADKNIGDQVFGADKRKVYTGPNPLHNR